MLLRWPAGAEAGSGEGCESAVLLAKAETAGDAAPLAALLLGLLLAALELASWYQSLGGRRRMATSSPSTARFWGFKPCTPRFDTTVSQAISSQQMGRNAAAQRF
jgi:hypothetical protein